MNKPSFLGDRDHLSHNFGGVVASNAATRRPLTGLVKFGRRREGKTTQERNRMKRVLLSMALAVAAPFAWAQVSETTTTTTTTEGNGTITEFSPGSTIVLKESAGPKHYRFGKKVTYVTRKGTELDEATVRTRIKIGAPVRVHYVGTGDNVMVDRVVLDED
jgi:hypothetical protein